MIIGICLKVPALLMPAEKNMTSMAHRKGLKAGWTVWVQVERRPAQGDGHAHLPRDEGPEASRHPARNRGPQRYADE